MTPLDHFDPARPNFSLSNAYAMAHLSNAAYLEYDDALETLAKWGFEDAEFFDEDATDSQAIAGVRDGAIFVAFRGTESARDVLVDVAAVTAEGPFGHAHLGFLTAATLLWSEVGRYVHAKLRESPARPVFITGHSLGGAVANLFAAMALQDRFGVAGLYTFGAPGVGDAEFALGLDARLPGRHHRVVNDRDCVPLLTPHLSHAGAFWLLLEGGGVMLDPTPAQYGRERLKSLLGDYQRGETVTDHKLGGERGYLATLARLAK